ncbi:hypothetical protein [Kamptonema formosum]|uniref:hypothetical protein n=1 Tax=Kamptonema formosum TaxID=331992 RepID=UPI00034660BF|nr:hypothetical protein [Oscillatoria sp. PCC 10802]
MLKSSVSHAWNKSGRNLGALLSPWKGVRRCPVGVALAAALGGKVGIAGMGGEMFRP